MKFNLPALCPTSLVFLTPVVKGWNFEVFDEDCVTFVDAYSRTTDEECENTPNSHQCFRISNMGTCELYLHATADDCENEVSEQFYGPENEDQDISPDFSWDSWSMLR